MTNDNLPLPDQLVRTTARIECKDQSGAWLTGTSFFFQMEVRPGILVPLLVTNRHVLEGKTVAKICVSTRPISDPKAPRKTEQFTLENLESLTFFHPDSSVDIAAIAIMPMLYALRQNGLDVDRYNLRPSDLPSIENLRQYSAIEEALLIGYPNGVWDQHNNSPIVHKALTATAIFDDFNGQPQFLLSAACYPGSSGSPVFLYSSGGYWDRNGKFKLGGVRFAFAGLVAATHLHRTTGEVRKIEAAKTPRYFATTEIPNHVAICVRATELQALLSSIRASAEPGLPQEPKAGTSAIESVDVTKSSAG